MVAKINDSGNSGNRQNLWKEEKKPFEARITDALSAFFSKKQDNKSSLRIVSISGEFPERVFVNGMPLEGKIDKKAGEMLISVDDWVFDQRVEDEKVIMLALFANPTRFFAIEFAPNDDFSPDKPQFAGKLIPQANTKELFKEEVGQFEFEQAKIAEEEAREAANRARIIDYTKLSKKNVPQEPIRKADEHKTVKGATSVTVEDRFTLDYYPKGVGGRAESVFELEALDSIEIGEFKNSFERISTDLQGRYSPGDRRTVLFEPRRSLAEPRLVCNGVEYVMSLFDPGVNSGQSPDLKVITPGRTTDLVHMAEKEAAERKRHNEEMQRNESAAPVNVKSNNALTDDIPIARKRLGDMFYVYIWPRGAELESGPLSERMVELEICSGKRNVTDFTINNVPISEMNGIYAESGTDKTNPELKRVSAEQLNLTPTSNVIIRFKSDGVKCELRADFSKGRGFEDLAWEIVAPAALGRTTSR